MQTKYLSVRRHVPADGFFMTTVTINLFTVHSLEITAEN